MKQQIITFTSDFGIQSQGVGNMEGVVSQIAPTARVIHLMHGLPSFDVRSGARTLEIITYMPVGFHVCVVDPGVGTSRKPIIIKVERGDCLIGPDNGVLIPAANILGGPKKIVEITNAKFMIQPVSPIFHGRHIFAPAAAYLAKGTPVEKFGPLLQFEDLVHAPYKEATIKNNTISGEVININKFGSLSLNILHSTWDKFNLSHKQAVDVWLKNESLQLPFVETFGQVEVNQPLILKDDYGRIEIAINLGSFAEKYNIQVGNAFLIKLPM